MDIQKICRKHLILNFSSINNNNKVDKAIIILVVQPNNQMLSQPSVRVICSADNTQIQSLPLFIFAQYIIIF